MIKHLPTLNTQIVPVKRVELDHRLVACPVSNCLAALVATAAEYKIVSDR